MAWLKAERRDLCSLIEDQRVALARTERELDAARKEVAHLRHQAARTRRWWWK